jgi:hypothetical protein
MGDGEYTITSSASPGRGGIAEAKRDAYTRASAQCAAEGKAIHVLNEAAQTPTWTDGLYHDTVNFACR